MPALLDRFFGREVEVARVCEEFSTRRTRLLTLNGIGGSGKTRLGIEAAYCLSETKNLSPDSSDFQSDIPTAPLPERAVFFVSLADLRDSDLILSAVLEVLGLPRAQSFLTGNSPQTRPADRLYAALNARPALRVLDNFEHLAATGAQFVEMLLSRVPNLQILVTSQQHLNILGERVLPVGALPVPLEMTHKKLQQAPHSTDLKYDLQQLLEYSSVQLFVDRTQAIAPDFQLTLHNAATPRHASLTTAISWSYQLLPPDLAQLRACSLLAVEEQGGEMRFRLLEMLREFAGEQLEKKLRRCNPTSPRAAF